MLFDNRLNRKKITEFLKHKKFTFNEFDSRMNYGAIGQLCSNNGGETRIAKVLIFGKTFYVHDKEFPINQENLLLIQSIQKEFLELSRDKNNRIVTYQN